MKEPILVIMAAGMGSRYGGLKQLDSVGPRGEVMLDYSLYDAKEAGFKKVIFIIKPDMAERFKAQVGDRVAQYLMVEYAFQKLEDLPAGFSVPTSRTKPWGTAHAVWCARDLIDAPFAVINADDFYGRHAFQSVYDYLVKMQTYRNPRYSMVGYPLKRTISANGAVSRGLCQINESGYLVEIEEQTQIEAYPEGIHYTQDGLNWVDVDPETIVSMNLWGFPQGFIQVIEGYLPEFLEKGLRTKPDKCEYYLPSVVRKQIKSDQARVKILETQSQWFGVTYQEDKPLVVEAIESLTQSGVYPSPLWPEL
ncbi:sugar phosphate nucleotidyltransferase [Abiotrophia defectiva]|uniref:nucleotidyltransferase family protein n=1 Tax=Abiotrophia defectiva TaxID=46125 RepID=UPI0028D3EAF0|nr:sugar phosphate nucleotidyltransferase [Abiotrophia defectiva]